MRESVLGFMVDSLREMLYQGIVQREGKRVVGLACDMLPVEVLSAYDLLPLKLPAVMLNELRNGTAEGEEGSQQLYDWIVLSEQCCNKYNYERGSDIPILSFHNPGGYGEHASRTLHRSLEDLLRKMGISLEKLDTARLIEVTDLYNTMRRLIRGISEMRRENPQLLSNDDMIALFEAAQCLPPALIIEHLLRLREAINTEGSTHPPRFDISALVSGGILTDGSFLDEIEGAGCLVAEDDLCNGRRQFDLSFNVSAPSLYHEILDAYSYRPLCPSKRDAQERFELLYRLLGNHGIAVVIFLRDPICRCRNEQIEFLRVKLMRTGIDPLVIAPPSVSAVAEYARRVRGVS
jgi:benzoyl-CoA reductase/2-hydroxyglutaryl-CoA dehydratase subunit BcrC/BadD/HgdB